MRRLVYLMTSLLLCACAPVFEGRGPLTEEARLDGSYVITQDGEKLFVQTWLAEDPKAILIGVHGFNDYSDTFYLAGPWWQERGLTTIAFDQRSFGHNNRRGKWPGSTALQQDLGDVVNAVTQVYPGKPVFLLGVSMGGAVVLTLPDMHNIRGQILSGPAIWGWKTLNPFYALTLSLSVRLCPSLTVTGKGLNIWPSDNIEMLRRISKDPLMVRETRTDAIYGLVDLMDDAYDQAADIERPTLLLYGQKDQIIPHHAMQSFLSRLNATVDVRSYDNGYHMLLRDRQAKTVWQDVLEWVLART